MHISTGTVVFDLDGTLADTAPDLWAVTNRTLARIGLAPVGLACVRRSIGNGARALLLAAARDSGRELSDIELEPLVELFRSDIAACPVRDSTVYPGVVEALEALRKDGFRLAVCTNKHAPLARLVLDGLGLSGWFDGVVGGDEAPANKPDPRHLALAIERACGSPDQAIMVGDARPNVTAARRLGIPVIVSSQGYGPETAPALGADAVYETFAAVPHLVRQLIAP